MTEPERPAPGPHLEPPADGRDPADHPHAFVQAPVAPLDVDGLTLVILGTLAFALASIALMVVRTRLEAAGHGWWLGVAVSGFVLGLIGLVYSWNRRQRRQAGHWNHN